MTEKKVLSSNKVPAAIGPFSQAIMADNVVYVSGQLPTNPKEGKITAETVKEQTKQSLTNVIEVLKEADMTLADVVKVTVLLNDMNDFQAMNEVYGEFFSEPYPARMAYEVARLPQDALVEIDAIAVK